jgi:hypothetical protein
MDEFHVLLKTGQVWAFFKMPMSVKNKNCDLMKDDGDSN